MDKATKIIIGAAVTSLMAWGAHSGIGMGGAFVDRLENNAGEALESKGISGVDIAMQREPALSRNIVLSGDESQKEAALTALGDVPGIGSVKWAGDEDEKAKTETPATAAAVSKCQADINTLMQDKTINFRSGSAYLAAQSNAIISELAAALKPCAGTKVEVQGHTDLTGDSSTNKALSQERADRVRKLLIEKGIPAERLTAKGYGSSEPVENAMTSQANAKNRRTIFKVSAAGATAAGNSEGSE